MKSLRPKSRDAITEAAFDLLSNNPGASLAEIAERAGVGRATLHRHFASRDDLISTLAHIAIKEMDEAAEKASSKAGSHTEALRLILEALIPLGDRYGFLSNDTAENDPGLSAEYERQLNETRELVEAAKKEGLFDSAVPTSWITQSYDHLLFAAWESVKAGEATHRQAADLAWRTLTLGLGDNRR